MILCEASSLSTTDLPWRAIANETFKEQSERKNWSFTTKYSQCYISLIQHFVMTSLSGKIVSINAVVNSAKFSTFKMPALNTKMCKK